MTSPELTALLDSNPDAEVRPDLDAEVDASLRYLASEEALASLDRDAYWPKWDSPWWHMLALHEMGLSERIPQAATEAMVGALNRLRVKFFPIHQAEVDPGWDIVYDSMCHCAVGSMVSVLTAAGVAVDDELPWMRPWLTRYAMADGGMSCDPEAYLVTGECPSSMVATVPSFEALLAHVPGKTPRENWHLDRAAGFLLGRELRLGSSSSHNAEEREAAERWLLPTFPRFYFYDVLRGLHDLLLWTRNRGRRVPWARVRQVVGHLAKLAPDGLMPAGRRAYEGARTRRRQPDGTWVREAASRFPLLQAVGRPGQPCPFLTRQWTECKRLLRELEVDPNPADVLLVPPSPQWPRMAEQEGQRFAALLGDNLIAVHHVGSTSIPGIWAKPTLDLAPEVRRVEAMDAIQDRIEAAGYQYWGEYGLPGRRFCPRVDTQAGRVANIHCYASGSSELHRHLAFRDYLRAHPRLAAEYEREKMRARDLFPFDVWAYNDEKNPWIRRTELQALEWASKVGRP